MTTPTEARRHSLVVGVDYSELAQLAVEVAALSGRHMGGAELHALAVATREGTGLPQELTEDVKQAFAAESQRTLEEYVTSAAQAPEKVAVNAHVAFGDPKERILELAKNVQAELIVLGTHGRRGLQRLMLGSVTESVIREATCPVLAVRQPEPPALRWPGATPKKIGVALDFSAGTRTVLLEAARWGARFKAELLVLHVLEPVQFVSGGALGMVVEVDQPIEHVTREHASARLENLVREVLGGDPRHVRTAVHDGVIGDTVPREIARTGCDWLVVGTHGRRGFQRALLGSVAEDLLRRCSCPVLAVHTGTAASN